MVAATAISICGLGCATSGSPGTTGGGQEGGPNIDLSVDALTDVNPSSATADQPVHPSDYAGKVSAWYFGHAT